MLKSSSPTVGGSGLPRLEILGIPFVYWDFGTLVLDLELSIEEGVGGVASHFIVGACPVRFGTVRRSGSGSESESVLEPGRFQHSCCRRQDLKPLTSHDVDVFQTRGTVVDTRRAGRLLLSFATCDLRVGCSRAPAEGREEASSTGTVQKGSSVKPRTKTNGQGRRAAHLVFSSDCHIRHACASCCCSPGKALVTTPTVIK